MKAKPFTVTKNTFVPFDKASIREDAYNAHLTFIGFKPYKIITSFEHSKVDAYYNYDGTTLILSGFHHILGDDYRHGRVELRML